MFKCEKCGLCCRNVGNSIFEGRKMALPNSICKYLNQNTNLCTIYEHRPWFCNVDVYYEKYCKNKMSKKEFYRLNKIECVKLRQNK